MRKKTVSIIFAVITAFSVILPHAPKIIPEGNSLIAAAAVAATLSIPSKSMAAIMPARIVQLAVAMPQRCEAGVMEQLCSSVTSFLNDEAARADTALKNCTKNCGWKKRKDDLIDAARKKAKESCARGEAPDINEVSKGLDGNTKAKLKNLYDSNSRMFDGSAKLTAKDFDVKSNQSPALTGKSGQVTDLKTAESATPKLNIASEFGLSGTKLSGELPAPAKQNAVLPASASPAKTSADTASVLPAKSTFDTAASANNALSLQKAVAASDPIIPMVRECKCYYGGLFLEVGEAETKCCVNGTPVAKCGSACWNPVVECCQDGKVYPGKTLYLGKCMTICEAILGRIGRINTYIGKWEADPNYTIEGDPNTAVVTTYAETFCRTLKGPEIKFYEAFYSLDPELQKAITVHENVHAGQCKPYTFLRITYYGKDKELSEKGGIGPFEIPAHEAEKRILETSADKLHCQ
ncbi:MAG: hypothetical protein HY796_03585 [Elusimicrobia bacterium]|nr:hypothetical protein [Elusimicrobiota bacterium]